MSLSQDATTSSNCYETAESDGFQVVANKKLKRKNNLMIVTLKII